MEREKTEERKKKKGQFLKANTLRNHKTCNKFLAFWGVDEQTKRYI